MLVIFSIFEYFIRDCMLFFITFVSCPVKVTMP